MDWLLLAILGIMWLAFLLPSQRRSSPSATVVDFGRRMELLAHAEVQGTAGRWIVTPRKGVRFVGSAQRRRVRARGRRRQVFTFLLESLGMTFLIGLVPPLRVIWALSAVLGALLLIYVFLLITIRQRAGRPDEQLRAALVPERTPRRVAERYITEGESGGARPRVNGLGLLGEGDAVHVVVRTPAQVGVAAAT